MKNVYVFLLAVVLALPMSAVAANAGESGDKVASPQWKHHVEVDDLKKQVEELQRKIEAIEQQQQVSDDDKWYNDVKASIKKGQRDLSWESADGNYKLRMRLRGQFLAEYVDEDGGDDSLGFRIRRARVKWDGHAFVPWFKYTFQVDFSREAELKDAIFDFAYNKQAVPRVGQYKVPFNRETLNSSSELQLVGRSIVEEQFTYDRDIGMSVWGDIQDIFTYHAGIFQGEGDNVSADSNDTGVLWAARAQFSPFGNDIDISPNFTDKPSLAMALGVAGINVETDAGGELKDANLGGANDRIIELGAPEAQVVSWTADINWKHPIFSMEGEYIGRWVDPEGGADSLYDQGFRVQGGVFLIPKRLEFAARYAYIAFDDEVGDQDNEWEITPGINYYLSEDHRWKIQIDYSFIRAEDVGGEQEDTNRLRAQLQAYF